MFDLLLADGADILPLPSFDLSRLRASDPAKAVPYGASSETGVLRDVLLAQPQYLEAVPCCAVTRARLRDGFSACCTTALAQHRALSQTLRQQGVQVVQVPALEGLADLCFVRDAVSISPWGLIRLAPAKPHRRREAEHVAAFAQLWGVPVLAPDFDGGTIEGGDVCLIRPGVLAIGVSGERTDDRGARVLADLYEAQGWEVILCPFDPHFLHLDTQFCMLDAETALACVDVLDDGFLDATRRLGIRLLPVSYKEVQALGCNIVCLGDGRILSATANRRVNAMLEAQGFHVIALPLDQFTCCGGGPHCLTMPLRRVG